MAAERIDVRALIKKAADVLDEDYFQMAAVEAAVAELIEAAKKAEAMIRGTDAEHLTVDAAARVGLGEYLRAALARMGEGA